MRGTKTAWIRKIYKDIERDKMIMKTAWIRKIYKDIESNKVITKTAWIRKIYKDIGGLARYSVHSTATALTKLLDHFFVYVELPPLGSK